MELTVEIAERAKRLGACSVPAVGTPIGQLKFSDLVWAEEHNLLTVAEQASLHQPASVVAGSLPLWAHSGSGYGYGSGYGAGDGTGAGVGNGAVAGYGNGYGYGYGYGSGYGFGYGAGE